MSEYVALIPAAGVGARAQLKLAKQFNLVGKKTIIEFAIDPFLKDENCKTIYVVVAEDTEAWEALSISQHNKVKTCIGASSRMLSVLNGLQEIKEDEDKSILVAVHDAARPCLDLKDLLGLMGKAQDEIKEDGEGCYLSYQPTESVNLVKNEKVQKSLDRNNVWLSATPQVFCLEDLLSALIKANDDEKVFTDEVSAMLHYFKKDISIYPCNKTNIKVTKKEDLETVEQYLKLAGRI
jgi:2-C-methyl-D-erythritol 4-phosphate cytidylyltransferase